MRIIYVIITLALVVLSYTCSEPEPEPQPHLLFDTWEWLESYGPYPPFHWTPDSVGYTETVVFTPDSQYREYRNDSLHYQTAFTLTLQDRVVGLQSGDTLRLGDSLSYATVHWEDRDTLLVRRDCIGCRSSRYSRQ